MGEFEHKMIGLLRAVTDLPTLPNIALDLLRALQDESYGASQVAMIIEEDVSLTANVLKLANSAYYGAGGTIVSVRDAVVRLGMRMISRLATSLAIIDTFKKESRRLDHKQFWEHSLTVAYSAQALVERTEMTNPFTQDAAFVGGLLHDVGVLILDQYFPEELERVLDAIDPETGSLADAELALLGTDHGAVGAYLLDIWNLPEGIAESVRFHHRPGEAPEEFRIHAFTIFLADQAAKKLEAENGAAALAETLARNAEFAPALPVADFAPILKAVRDHKKRSGILLSLT